MRLEQIAVSPPPASQLHLALDTRGSVDNQQDIATAASTVNAHQSMVGVGAGGTWQGVFAGCVIAGNNQQFVRHMYNNRTATRIFWQNNIGAKWGRHQMPMSLAPIIVKPAVAMPGDQYETVQVSYTFAFAGVPLGPAIGFGRYFGLQFMPPGIGVANQPWLSAVNNVMGWGIRGGNGSVHWVSRNAATGTNEQFTEDGIFGTTAGFPAWPVAFGDYQRVTVRMFSANPVRDAYLVVLCNGQTMLTRSWGVGTVLPDYGGSGAMGFRTYLDVAGDPADAGNTSWIELAGIEVMMGPDTPLNYLV